MISKQLNRPKLLKIASAALFIGALAFAWLGYSAQSKPSPTAQALDQPSRYDIWVFSESAAKGDLIRRDLLETKSVHQLSNNYILDPGQAIGKRLNRSIRQGAVLTNDLLAVDRPIVDELPPHHRAVAIKANEVLSVGGYLQAGDHVDIMYLLKPNKETGTTTTARRLASNVPILAIGNQVTSTDENDVNREEHAKSIVLCVHESLAPVILLAELTGELRLAAVGSKDLLAENPLPSVDSESNTMMPLASSSLANEDNAMPTTLASSDYTVNLQRFSTQSIKSTSPAQAKPRKPATLDTYVEIIQGGERSMVKATK